MRQLNFVYTTKEDFLAFLQKENVQLFDQNILVQIFTSKPKEEVEPALEDIASLLPKATIVGMSSAGEIVGTQILEKSIVVALSLFEKSQLASYYSDEEDSRKLGEEIARRLISKKSKGLILFVEGLHQNGEEMLQGVYSIAHPTLKVAGGMAADLFAFQETFVIHQKNIYTKGSVAVALEGEELEIVNDFNLGWRPVGPKFIITKASGNRVYTIENKSVVEFYKEVVGDDVAKNLPASAVEFPLLKDEGGILIARAMIKTFEDGSATFAGILREGEAVRVGIGSPRLINRYNPAKEIEESGFQAGFIYSCSARRIFFANELEKNLKQKAHYAPLCGCFTYGELYQDKLLNVSSTLLFLREKGTTDHNWEVVEYKQDEKPHCRYTEQASLHLIDYISKNLQAQQEQFEKDRFLFDEFVKAVDSTVIISKTDPKGIITYVNKKFEEISGYSKEELLGKPHNIVRDPLMDSQVFKELWDTIKQGKVWEGLISNRAKDGSRYFVKTHIFPIFDQEGNIVEYLAIREDVTELVRLQEAYERELQFSKMLLDNEENIIIVEKNGQIVAINETFYRIFPYENMENFLSWHDDVSDLFVEKSGYLKRSDPPAMWYEPVLKEPHKTHLALMVDRFGHERIFSIKSRQIEVEEDSYIIHTFNDITELEQAKQEAERAKEVQARFLANMSHEIRTPMNGVIGFTELLQATNLDERQKKYVDMIASSAKTLLDIINDILDFSKIKEKKIELEQIEINPFIELATTFELIRTLAKKKGIEYTIALDPELSECLVADPTRLRQVVTNLLSNAIKFTPNGGKVRLEAKVLQDGKTTQKVRILVSDTGIGIPKEKLKTIFEPFMQADSSTTRKYGGTGLGLAISYDLVKLFGGDLKVDSKEGEGTTFYFDINYRKCDKTKSLKRLLERFELVIVQNGENPVKEELEKILDSFGIAYEETPLEHLPNRVHSNTLVIALDGESAMEARGLVPQERLICIKEAYENCLQLDCNVAKIGEDFVSNLYNILLSKSQTLTHSLSAPKLTKPMHLLIVEDYEMNRVLMDSLLQNFPNITYEFAIDGEEAVQKATQKAYDLILMDVNMPKRSGVEATKMLRQKGVNTPIVALTANVLEGDKERFLEAGMDDYLSKPIQQEELQRVLAKYGSIEDLGKEEIVAKALDMQEILSKAQEGLGLEVGMIKHLLRKYLSSLQDALKEFQEALKANDLAKIADLAHKLKGSSGTLGFEKMMKLMGRVEKEAKESKEVDNQEIANTIKEHIEFLESEIKM